MSDPTRKIESEDVEPWELPEFGQSGKQAQSLMQAARLTAEQIEEIQEKARKEAAESGYKDGFSKGIKAGEAEVRQTVAQLLGIMSTLSEPLEQLDERIENELAQLSIQIARQLIRRELKLDPGQVIAVVREAISALPSSSQNVTLHLHPDDAELVRSALAIDAADTRWKIIEDPIITRGGCQVMSDTSRIDATIENRLATVIAKALGDERQRG